MDSACGEWNLDHRETVRQFKNYLLSNCREELLKVMSDPDTTKHFGIHIRCDIECFSHGIVSRSCFRSIPLWETKY